MYDYEGAVLGNQHAPAMWNRFMIKLVRVFAGRAGLSEREWRKLVRVAYARSPIPGTRACALPCDRAP